ncbi:MAG TPA: monofunctional biosynthetic peptidoglycan transglycosylase [Kofleriaceae bacterium]|nr:monofunctional biosynthetic peptidoglycan transglycosylase [Kofleriaceae bacterium]
MELSPPPPSRRWPRRALAAAELAVLAATVAALGLRCSVPDTARLAAENPTSTAFIDLRRAEAEAAGRPFPLRWEWRPLPSISRYLRAAVIYAEDYNFYRHDGVDWHALEHAVSADWNHGAMSIGGSTITQQLAKNLYLSPRRSLLRKARELLIAYALEDELSKQRILELYLNIVEWGDGVFGAEAAARTWFHHAASALTPAEAVRLAIALPNPITRAPTVRDRELTRKAVRLIRFLRMQGLIGAAQERTALDEVGAPDERVLPDREIARAKATAAPAPAEPAAAAPPAPSAPPAPEPSVPPAPEPSAPPAPEPATPPRPDEAPPAPQPDSPASPEPSPATPSPAREPAPAAAPSPSSEPSGSDH